MLLSKLHLTNNYPAQGMTSYLVIESVILN